MSDANHRLNEILSEYEVVPDNAIRDNAIGFWLHGKRWLYTYQQADHEEIASGLHRRLRELGAKPKQQEIVKPRIRVAVQSEPAVAKPAPKPAEAASVEAAPAPRTLSRVFDHEHGYAVFQSRDVIAIELDRDLTIPKGNVLVIPLNRADTLIDMPSDQFHVLFDEAVQQSAPQPEQQPQLESDAVEPEEAEPADELAEGVALDELSEAEVEEVVEEVVEEEPAAPPRPVPPPLPVGAHDVIRFLRDRNGAVRSKVIAAGLGRTIKSVESHLRLLQKEGSVITASPGFFTLASKPSPTHRTISPKAPPPVESTKPIYRAPVQSSRSREGVGAQMGRILIAMAYATKNTGKTDLTTLMVTPNLSERDSRQYGARLPDALKAGYVERGIPLQATRGWHYKITQKGRELARKLGEWPFRQDHEDVPEWLPYLFE